MKNIIKKLLEINYFFDLSFFDKKKQFLIISSLEEKYINKIISEKNKYILDISKKKKINLAFFLNFLNLFFFIRIFIRENLTTAYYALNIKCSKCEKIITFYDNDINFYKLKNYFPFKKFISIQNGSRHLLNDIFGTKEIKNHKNLKADLIFVFNPEIKKKFESFVDAKVIVTGCYKNNMLTKYYKNNKTQDIAYISQYRDNIMSENKFFYWNNIKITKKEYYQNEKNLLRFILNFCIKNKINLYIICSSTKLIEKKYFKSLVPNQKIYFINKSNDNLSVYKSIHLFKMIVCSWSTLGYESLSRNIKTCFFRQKVFDLPDRSFGWPSKTLKETFFYTENVNEKKVNEILKKTYFMSQAEWIYKTQYLKNKVMSYDYHNSKLIKSIKNV